jgi:hypothetical protein
MQDISIRDRTALFSFAQRSGIVELSFSSLRHLQNETAARHYYNTIAYRAGKVKVKDGHLRRGARKGKVHERRNTMEDNNRFFSLPLCKQNGRSYTWQFFFTVCPTSESIATDIKGSIGRYEGSSSSLPAIRALTLLNP